MDEDLKRRAEQDETTIPAILQVLTTDRKCMQEWFGQVDSQLNALRREVRKLRQWLTIMTEVAKHSKQPSICRSPTVAIIYRREAQYDNVLSLSPIQFSKDVRIQLTAFVER